MLEQKTASPALPLELDGRTITDDQLRRFERYMAEIFTAFRMDVDSPSTADTPRRYIRALHEATAGYDGDPKLLTLFDAEDDGVAGSDVSQVIEGPIPFYALCEHHALPFFGRAHVGYIAGDRIIGISKLIRVVRLFARRFTVQERLGHQIAETLEAALAPRGVAVMLEADHLCTQMRGVHAATPTTFTTTWRGAFALDADLRAEFLAACRR